MARILLAESDQQIRRLIAGILADCGHAVELCTDAIEASASLTQGAVDFVVTDLVLGAAGEGALGCRCVALGIPTFTLSGREFRPGETAAERPLGLREKPFRFADLQSMLDAVAQRPQTAGGDPGK